MAECKECKFFVQGIGHSGACKERPYVSARRGGMKMVNGKPRRLVVYWSKKACKKFERTEAG